MKTYGAYLFRDKDPSIDLLRTQLQRSNGGGPITSKMLRKLAANGGPTTSCMAAWFFGKTQRPQNATIEAAGRAAGFKRQWVPLTATEQASVARDVGRQQRKRKRK